jgi:hypothetical protein
VTPKTNRIEIDLVPLKLFSRRISEGWAMVPGYPLLPGDYAVTMMPPNLSLPRWDASKAAIHRANMHTETRPGAATGTNPETV